MTTITHHYRKPITSNDVVAFSIGLLSLFYVNIVGQLYVSEIFLIFCAPLLWLKRGRTLIGDPNARKILVLGIIWFFGQAITDIIRQTPFIDLSRGWAGIVVLLFSISSLYLLLNNDIRRIKIFAFGYAVSGLLSTFIQPSPYFKIEPWKFGYGWPIILLVILFIIFASRGQINRMRRWVWLFVLFGAASFYLNARSLGGIVILCGVILWLRTSNFTRGLLARVRVLNLIVTALVLVGFGWGLLQGYAYAAELGWLGQNAREKYELQDSGSVWGILLGGRFEILGSSQAIIDSPIIGHGSWAKGAKYRVFMYHLIELGFNIEQGQLDYYVNSTDLIPTHSHFTQAWVWSGILGAVFWFWILIFMGKAVLKENNFPGELYPLVIYFGIAAIWDILFSPLGSFMRILWALRFITFLSTQRKG